MEGGAWTGNLEEERYDPTTAKTPKQKNKGARPTEGSAVNLQPWSARTEPMDHVVCSCTRSLLPEV